METIRQLGERVLPLTDPHGLSVALVEAAETTTREFEPWAHSPVPVERQVRGLHGARAWERDRAATAWLLTNVLGFSERASEEGWTRYVLGEGGPGRVLDIKETPDVHRGAWGTGSIHHLAWRVNDDAHELAVRSAIEATKGSTCGPTTAGASGTSVRSSSLRRRATGAIEYCGSGLPCGRPR